MKGIGKNPIILIKNSPASDYVGDVLKNPFQAEWYHSIIANDEKMERYTVFSTSFIRSLLPPEKNTPPKNIFDSQYNIYWK